MSVSNILYGGCAALSGGVSSTIYTWFLNKTGAVQNLAGTSAPLLPSAFVFGAINASIDYSATALQERVKADVLRGKNETLEQGVDLLKLSLCIASRYAVAKVSSKYFGMQVTTKFVHLLTAADIVSSTSNCGTLYLTTVGLISGVAAKIYSIALAAPLFKNAFYFGVLSAAAQGAIQTHYPKLHGGIKKHAGITDPRILYISHLAFGLSTLGATYALAKVCNKYFDLNLSSEYLLLTALLSIPGVVAGSIISHISSDFLDSDFEQIKNNLINSENPQTKHIIAKITEILSCMDEVDRNIMVERFQEGNYDAVFQNLGEWLGPQLGVVVREIFNAWLKGSSIEEICTNSVEILGSNAEVVNPVLDAISQAVGSGSNQAGAQFIANHVLENASEETKEAFIMVNSERDTLNFITTKAVSAYIVGDQEGDQLPSFFTSQTREEIRLLRNQLNEQENLRDHYVAINLLLEESAKKTSQENFFAFKDSLTEEQQVALTRMQGIGFPETRTTFARNCCRLAAELLNQ